MPYVDNYKQVLDKHEVDYDIINWDRFHIETTNELTYRDAKIGHSRNLIDYYKFKRFISKKISEKKYEKIIVFGIQLAFFLQPLLKDYKNKYILDIRDYNRVIRFFNIKIAINNSTFTVLSSPGFKKWLPNTEKYVLNHNTRIEELKDIDANLGLDNNRINISYIGTIRDFNINLKLINSLKNNKNFNLYFHGDGIINGEIEDYIQKNKINNVYLTGRYKREEEANLYSRSHFINVLIPDTDINSKTLLPNRLYNAVIYGKPILTYEGTYLSELVFKTKLGLVLNTFDGIDKQIQNYLNEFNKEKFKKYRADYLKRVVQDNMFFKEKLLDFVK